MAKVVEQIVITAPIDQCFDMARNIDYHSVTVWKHTNEKAIEGKVTGLIEEGESVTFEARHFGIRQRLTSKVKEMKRPYYFIDEMQKGAFAHMIHKHEFKEISGGTLMMDILDFRSPYGLIGLIFDKFVLERYMKAFVKHRQHQLKKLIEANFEKI